MGAPSLMLWLVMSSLVIGVSQFPTGASFAAMVVVRLCSRTDPAKSNDSDLQISRSDLGSCVL